MIYDINLSYTFLTSAVFASDVRSEAISFGIFYQRWRSLRQKTPRYDIKYKNHTHSYCY